MIRTLDDLVAIYRDRGSTSYAGEAVTQLEHALQCATLAREANAPPTAIAACLLHDLGHLIADGNDPPAREGIDNRHEYRAAATLRPLFDEAITAPIRLHVQAKRYLCTVDPSYGASLSPASQLSLALQGGTLSPAEVEAFRVTPYALQAVQLRRWDEAAKVVGARTPPFAAFLPILTACQRR